MIEFEAWPKVPRLFRDCVITEKIDGTNAAVVIEPLVGNMPAKESFVLGDDRTRDYVEVAAQSRNRLITPDSDNYGFAAWVYENAQGLAEALGPGRHFGEWWGSGIQRRYGLDEKRFSLFNTHRWAGEDLSSVPGLGVVPRLYEGTFSTGLISLSLANLKVNGSYAAPGFDRPEGIVVYHGAAKQSFKVLIENDELPKSLVAA